MVETISADYLVVGAGAMGMAFVDTLLSDTTATVALVDRFAQPGGHWTTAYPYVRLHQPSIGYGVNSRRLGEDKVDEVGWNKGLLELASGAEVCGYYGTVMHQTFLPSGRVAYYPKHDYKGDGEFQSLITGQSYRVGEGTRIVDATYMKVLVPSMRPPPYKVLNGVNLVTPNDLPNITRSYGGYTVVGGGKTGLDACLWLLAQGVDPQCIKLILPRDPWLLDRFNFQPGGVFLKTSAASMAAINEAIMAATSPEDLFRKLETAKQLMRFDEKVWPTMYRCCTVTQLEFESLKKVGEIVRLGRVVCIGTDEVQLETGTYKPIPDTLYVDCSANSIPKRDPVPVFNGKQITLQPVRFCQQVFSAAFIAHAEAAYGENEELKNELCQPVPHPDQNTDYIRITLQTYRNALRWASEPKTWAWLDQARLNWFRNTMPEAPADPVKAAEHYAALAAGLQAVIAKLKKLMGQLPENDGAREGSQMARL